MRWPTVFARIFRRAPCVERNALMLVAPSIRRSRTPSRGRSGHRLQVQ
ncbi:hypothetical protein [Lysobacter gummosus]